jgi:CheY-like chemotaxis protein
MSCRVLVIEDEVIVAMMVEDMLGELGCEVAAIATHFSQALELARGLDIDFAVLDVNLNGKLSLPVADALTARGIPFAFATGYGGKALSGIYAAAPRLQKPFQIEDLSAVLRRYALPQAG